MGSQIIIEGENLSVPCRQSALVEQDQQKSSEMMPLISFSAFSAHNYRRGQCRFVVVTLMLLLLACMRQYCYAMLMFPFKTNRNHGEMSANDAGAATLPRIGCICAKSPTFCAITHRAYFILFRPAKAHHH